MKKNVIFAILFILFAVVLYAQKIDNDTTFKEVKTSNITQSDQLNTGVKEFTPLSSWEFTLSLVVLGFGMLVILIETLLILKKRIGPEYVIRFITITLIITSTLFLITAGYSNNQIAPAMGLLGTIAGYLLGRNQDEKKDDEKKDKPKNE